MKAVFAFLLFAGTFVMTSAQSAVFQQNGEAGPPFKLEITANLDSRHSNEWDFVNSASTTVKVGSMIVLAIRKTNISDHEIGRWAMAGVIFNVRDSSDNPVAHKKSAAMQGSVKAMRPGTMDMVLQPGQSDIEIGRLSEGYDLTQPGTYTIQVSQHAISSDPQSPVAKSNTIEIHVIPAD